MNKIYPPKLQKGDEIRVIAPSCSAGIISAANREIANNRLKDLGLKITYGKHIEEMDIFRSSSIKSRIEDLHEAFLDKNVKAVLRLLEVLIVINYLDILIGTSSKAILKFLLDFQIQPLYKMQFLPRPV